VKINRTALIAFTAFAALAAGMAGVRSHSNLIAPASAEAQSTGMRVVSGAVLDGEEPVVGATVFLQDQKTKAIRSFSSIEKGHYFFAQVKMAGDYDLWAEKGGKKSAVKTVSSWDSRTEFVTDLRLK
jgi:hypothetical protein